MFLNCPDFSLHSGWNHWGQFFFLFKAKSPSYLVSHFHRIRKKLKFFSVCRDSQSDFQHSSDHSSLWHLISQVNLPGVRMPRQLVRVPDAPGKVFQEEISIWSVYQVKTCLPQCEHHPIHWGPERTKTKWKGEFPLPLPGLGWPSSSALTELQILRPLDLGTWHQGSLSSNHTTRFPHSPVSRKQVVGLLHLHN